MVPYFYSVFADWGELEYVGPAYEWDEEIMRGSFEDGAFTNWYLKDGAVKAALTFGRSDDLDAARRLLVGRRRARRAQRAALGDLDADWNRRTLSSLRRGRFWRRRRYGSSSRISVQRSVVKGSRCESGADPPL